MKTQEIGERELSNQRRLGILKVTSGRVATGRWMSLGIDEGIEKVRQFTMAQSVDFCSAFASACRPVRKDAQSIDDKSRRDLYSSMERFFFEAQRRNHLKCGILQAPLPKAPNAWWYAVAHRPVLTFPPSVTDLHRNTFANRVLQIHW